MSAPCLVLKGVHDKAKLANKYHDFEREIGQKLDLNSGCKLHADCDQITNKVFNTWELDTRMYSQLWKQLLPPL